MQLTGHRLIAAAALGLVVSGAALAQQTAPAPDPAPASEGASTDAPATDAPTTNAPAADEPSAVPSDAPDVPLTDVTVEDKAPAAVQSGDSAPATTGATAGDAAPAAGASDGAAGPGNPGAGGAEELTEYTRDTFDAWEVRCLTGEEECFMYQLAVDESENPIAEVSIQKLDAANGADAGVTVVTPLGTLLNAGVTLQVDSDATRQYPFNWCSQVGCFARFGLDPEAVTAMKRGQTVKLTLTSVGAPDTPLTVPVSLKGFTAAFDSLTAVALP